MKADEDIEDPISKRRLSRKMLERWENEGGKIRTDPGNTSQRNVPRRRGSRHHLLSPDGSAEGNDTSFSKTQRMPKKD